MSAHGRLRHHLILQGILKNLPVPGSVTWPRATSCPNDQPVRRRRTHRQARPFE